MIDAAKITPGMIKLGGFGGHMYPNSGIHITQWGGEIIFDNYTKTLLKSQYWQRNFHSTTKITCEQNPISKTIFQSV